MKTLWINVVALMLLSGIFLSMQPAKPAYKLYRSDGTEIPFDEMVTALLEADIIFFGELHNNAIAHWLQIELAKSLYTHDSSALIMGAEMFESDNQLLMDEYLKGVITERSFEHEARLWNNYKTDYKPLVTFAKDNGLRFIATNIPRRYASLVHSKGFEALDSLSDEAKKFIAPLPVSYDPELACYKNMLDMMRPSNHVNLNLPKAQAIKDATMAHFIAKNHLPGSRLLHFNGSYHSDNHEGIVWYLQQQHPKLKIITITTVEEADINTPDSAALSKADFILMVNELVTKTY